MRRSNAVSVKVDAPSLGLQTRLPSNLSSPDDRAVVIAENVRAEQGVLRNAPGYERIVTAIRNLDGPANMIWQANLLDANPEVQKTPFIGTSTSLFTLRRRSQELLCTFDDDGGGGPGTRSCTLAGAFLADSGTPGVNLAAVASLIKSRLGARDIVIHGGDSVYANPPLDPSIADLEECIGQYFGSDFIGGYAGLYGFGPTENRFFPVLGNHDFDDLGLTNYLDFYQLAKNPNERYYHFKRGPVHHIVYSGYVGVEADGTGLGSTQADWLQSVLEESDCPHIILWIHFPLYTSDSAYYPGNATLQTLAPLLAEYGVIVVAGHSHNSELLQVPDIAIPGGTATLTQLVCGVGGHSLRAFNDPMSPYSVWGNDTDYGALFFDADREEITFEWVNTSGTVLRTLTLPAAREGSGICYVGDAAKTMFTLEIRPDEASVEVSHSWPYRAFANYMDGTVEDVTERCVWTSSDDSIGTVGANTGVATGNSPGTVTLTAEYLDESDIAQFRVLHSCLDAPTEVVFVVDRSSEMGAASGGSTRLEHVKEGIRRSSDGFTEGRDFLGLVSFAGVYADQTEDAILNSQLSNDFSDLSDALSLLSPDGSRGISAGLDTALAELTGPRHVTDNRRAAVLIVTGPADVVDPGGTTSSYAASVTAAMTAAATSADAIKALTETKLVVIGYNVAETYRDDIRDLASPGYYFSVESAEELQSVMGGLASLFCYYDDYYYYGPGPDPEEPICNRPLPDYTSFYNWDVVRGCVDLAGVGPNGEWNSVAWNPIDGNGFYVDMIGTNVNNCTILDPRDDTTCGKLQSKVAFNFEAGKQYRLTVRGANYAANSGAFLKSVDTSITNSVLAPVTFTPTHLAFEDQVRTWTQGATTTGKIVIDSERVGLIGGIFFPKQGVLIDRVLLENVTDVTTLLDDNFDTENPCEI